jgi:hypothetical protein
MKHTTPTSRWIKALFLDAVLIGGYTYSVYAGFTVAQSVYIFMFWWLLGLGFLVKVWALAFTAAGKSGRDPRSAEVADKFWDPKLVDELAHSNTFAVYHGLTDLFLICVLVVAGHPVLASLKVVNYLLSLAITGEARARKIKQLTSTQEP